MRVNSYGFYVYSLWSPRVHITASHVSNVAKEINIQFRVSDLSLDRRGSVDGAVPTVDRWNRCGYWILNDANAQKSEIHLISIIVAYRLHSLQSISNGADFLRNAIQNSITIQWVCVHMLYVVVGAHAPLTTITSKINNIICTVENIIV